MKTEKLTQIEFRDKKINTQKTDLAPEEWYKIPLLSSNYNSVESYRNRIENKKVQEDFVESLEKVILVLQRMKAKMSEIERVMKQNGEEYQEFRSTLLKFDTTWKVLSSIHSSTPEISLLLLKCTEAWIEYISGIYISRVKKWHLDKKQALKIIKGQVREVHPIFDPKTRDEALMCNFHGTQCQKCKSWRTDLAPDGIEFKCKCYVCDARFERGIISKCGQCHIPFYDAVIKRMKETAIEIHEDKIFTRCIKCNNEISLSTKQLDVIQIC
ncbi:MAG: hypothetical protein WAN47_04955 [Nitrosotalea sp.]